MASISDIVEQYTEMRQGLKQLGIELETHWPNPDDIQRKKLSKDNHLENELDEIKEETSNDYRSNTPTAGTGSNKESETINQAETSNAEISEGSNKEAVESRNDDSDNQGKHLEVNDNDNQGKVNEKDKSEISKDSDNDVKEDTVDSQKVNNEHHTQIEESLQSLDRFLQVMEEYCSTANNRFEELEALYVNVDVKWKDVMLYYGENPKTMRPDEFFSIFSQFIQSWKVATVEELRHTEKVEREEKRRLEIEQKKLAILSPNTAETVDDESQSPTDKVGNDRSVMDDLLEQLRSGKVENKVRQRRRVRELKNMKRTEDQKRLKLERKRFSHLSLKRRDSSSSSISFDKMPGISAEELLRNLMQEDD